MLRATDASDLQSCAHLHRRQVARCTD